MRSHQAGFLAVRALDYLRDWKDAVELSRDMQIPLSEAKALLKDLYKKGLVWRDGHKYIRRGGA